MGLVALLLCCVLGITASVVSENELLRALITAETSPRHDFKSGRSTFLDYRRKLKTCERTGGTCGLVSRCCGSLKCYRENGLNLKLKKGQCVDCIKAGQVCQRESQCCGNLMCDHERVQDMNGVCGPKRKNGPCWEDGQCEVFCKIRGASAVYGRCY